MINFVNIRTTKLRLLAGLLVVCAVVSPAAVMEPDILGSWPGYPTRGQIQRVAASGDFVIVTSYDYYSQNELGVYALQIGDSVEPTVVASHRIDGHPRAHLVTSGERVFIAGRQLNWPDPTDDDRELVMLEVAGTGQFSEAGRFSTDSAIVDLAVAGDYVYLLTTGGLQVYDVSNPSAASRVSSLATIVPGELERFGRIAIRDQQVLITGTARDGDEPVGFLAMIDVSDPIQPEAAGYLETIGGAEEIAVMGQHALVGINGRLVEGEWVGVLLRVIDISSPAQLQEISTYAPPAETSSLEDIAVSGSSTFLLWSINDPDGDGMEVVDFSNPNSPVPIGMFRRRGGHFSDLDVQGNKALIADIGFGLRVIDITDPVEPTQTSNFIQIDEGLYFLRITDNLALVQGIDEPGSHILVAALDISDPEHPTQIPWEVTGGFFNLQIFLHNGLVFEHRRYDLFFEIHDLSDPLQPRLLSRYDAPEREIGLGFNARSDFRVEGDRVYFTEFIQTGPSTEDRFLHVIDISDPENLELIAIFDGDWITSHFNSDGLPVSPDFSYVKDSEGSWRVIDNSAPAEPKHLGPYAGLASLRGVGRVIESENKLYRSENGGFSIQDISSPGSPRLIGEYSGFEEHFNLPVSESFIYQWDVDRGWLVTDISTPSAPESLGSYEFLASLLPPSTTVISRDFALKNNELVDLSDPQNPQVFAELSDVRGVFSLGGIRFAGFDDNGFVAFEVPALLRIGPAFVREEDQKIRLPLKGVNVKTATIQRSTDMITWEDWKTLDLEEENCEAVDLITGEPQYFYRAVEATESGTD